PAECSWPASRSPGSSRNAQSRRTSRCCRCGPTRRFRAGWPWNTRRGTCTASARKQRVRRGLRHPAPGDVGPVDRLRLAEDVLVARGRVVDAVIHVKRPAVDCHRSTILAGGATETLELLHIARLVELELEVRGTRMLAYVGRRSRVDAGQVVGI